MKTKLSQYGDIIWESDSKETKPPGARWSPFYKRWIISPSTTARTSKALEWLKTRGLSLPGEAQSADELVEDFQMARIALSQEVHPREPILDGVLDPFHQAGALYAALVGQCIIADPLPEDRRMAALGAFHRLGHKTCIIVCHRKDRPTWEQDIQQVFKKAVIRDLIGEESAAAGFWMVDYETLQQESAIKFPTLSEKPLIIVDHAEHLKYSPSSANEESRRSRHVRALAKMVHDLILLTALPFNVHPSDLRGLLNVLDKYSQLHPVQKWLQDRSLPGDALSKNDASTLFSALRATCMVRRGDLAGALPKREYIAIRDLTDDELAVAASAMHQLGLAKIDGALNWFKYFPTIHIGKVLVVAHHNRVVEGLAAGLGAPSIYSKTSPLEREERWEAFCASAGAALLVISDNVHLPSPPPELAAVVQVEILNINRLLERFQPSLRGVWYCLIAGRHPLDLARWDRSETQYSNVRKILDGAGM